MTTTEWIQNENNLQNDYRTEYGMNREYKTNIRKRDTAFTSSKYCMMSQCIHVALHFTKANGFNSKQ